MVAVNIDARIEAGRAGGIQQATSSLAYALGCAAFTATNRLAFVTLEGKDEWLRPNLPEGATTSSVGEPVSAGLRRTLRQSAPGRRVLAAGAWAKAAVARPEQSFALLEAGADVVHFPTQRAALTSAPFIYQPWDLQHEWFPQFFTRRERMRRRRLYTAYCHAATAVVVATEFTRDDLCGRYGIDRAKVHVIAPMASALPVGGERPAAPAPAPEFALFPGQAWPHKNHERLIQAVALLRQRRVDVTVVCPGATNERAATLLDQARDRGVGDLFFFPGYVSEATLTAWYRQARCLIYPTLHEGWCLPIIEAQAVGTPVAVSGIPSLHETVAGAAATFDPTDVEDIAATLSRVWQDEDLRRDLSARGSARAAALSWQRIGEEYAALYRTVAQAPARSLKDVAELARI